MFNDRSSPAALLATRRSGKPRDMVAPGPDAAQLRTILEAAMRVPDHGKLAPWRFVIIEANRRAAFADLLVSAYRGDKPDAGRLELEAMEQFAHQAPVMVAVLSTPARNSKIPLWEQELSAGAACMNLLAATHAAGFVGGWLTGWPAYSPQVLESLGGAPNDRIAGFIFLGSPSRELEERPRPTYEAVVSTWKG
ncbi:nitroreductase family protein [Rhizorhabdus dicambivorans]|uniref:Putative NAD(P)H nitroreductase n=1 Tax=Rhizorhabdus dicambivorans TaxID=1850238 RepID=A0A2A4G136_9SPHN|nr:nitroreductase [Rhizorhabdus dicambivorans]ATE64925.1 nitroreductase [Rhizorhabdus dicambivorans]PCE44199.1 nitroreductase [Rhizorhabdus dicambivorans]